METDTDPSQDLSELSITRRVLAIGESDSLREVAQAACDAIGTMLGPMRIEGPAGEGCISLPSIEFEPTPNILPALALVTMAVAEHYPYAVAIFDAERADIREIHDAVESLLQADPDLEIVVIVSSANRAWAERPRDQRQAQIPVIHAPIDQAIFMHMVASLAEKWILKQKALLSHDALERRVEERTAQLAQANHSLREEIETRAVMERELRKAQKLEAIGRLASGIAHEINTPVQFVSDHLAYIQDAISTCTEALELRLPSGAKSHASTQADSDDSRVGMESPPAHGPDPVTDALAYAPPAAALLPALSWKSEAAASGHASHVAPHIASPSAAQAASLASLATPLATSEITSGDASQEEARALVRVRECLTDGQLARSIEAAFSGLDRVTSIVRSMKELAHPGQKDQAPADLARALTAAIEVTRHEHRLVADVVTKFEHVPHVTCHIGDLSQVFINLLVNAVYAIKDKQQRAGEAASRGTITVSVRPQAFCCATEPVLRSDLVRPEDDELRPTHVVVDIGDTGMGIAAAHHEQVFEPFFTTKPVGEGSGQGLALARTIVEYGHQGAMRFASVEGQGTIFSITLPIHGRAPDPHVFADADA